jgi:phosphopantothenoylcysteine decarboxylase/phosphopantothenate--cysteine ligase
VRRIGKDFNIVSVLSGSRIIVGVSGGIAAYKAADFTSKLVQAGCVVDVAMTDSALQFVGIATFEALTKRPVFSSVFTPWREEFFGHITLGHEARAIVVIPASANTIAKLANGIADDMLGTVALSTHAPLIVVPAMEHEMYHHPATQANLAVLRERGATQVGPESGRLASGEYGEGRMSSPESVLGALRQVLGRSGPLAGKHVVISAGGTREPLDPIRYLGNRSSGLMGYSVAQAAIDAGASVTLVSSATGITPPYGAAVVRVQTAQQMLEAVVREVEHADILVMSAAVADFRPAFSQPSKIKKHPGLDSMQLELTRTTDILGSIDKPGLVKVGFAAETENLLEYAAGKLREKGLAMIVANDAEATIGSAESTAHLLFAEGAPVSLPRLPKAEVAERVVAEIARIVASPADA